MQTKYKQAMNIVYEWATDPIAPRRTSLIDLDKSYHIVNELKKIKRNNLIQMAAE